MMHMRRWRRSTADSGPRRTSMPRIGATSRRHGQVAVRGASGSELLESPSTDEQAGPAPVSRASSGENFSDAAIVRPIRQCVAGRGRTSRRLLRDPARASSTSPASRADLVVLARGGDARADDERDQPGASRTGAAPARRDPLAQLEIDPLRPLNNLLWGYVQDEQHRLTVARRAYEYDHHYGLTLLGKAVPPLRGADSRSRFLEAFHNLLLPCVDLLQGGRRHDRDRRRLPGAQRAREVHLLLAEGAHNQYGDLPWTARQEMLMQQWLLARPEMREFLPRRIDGRVPRAVDGLASTR